MVENDILILEKDFVLDAKYKKYAQNGNKLDIAIDDINQIVTYMFRLKSQKVALYVR